MIAARPHPVFVHSLFRSGSTYLWEVFRRSGLGYRCFQESLHELAVAAKDDPDVLLAENRTKAVLLRHPDTISEYFRELYDAWPHWRDIIRQESVYDTYFAPPGRDLGIGYWACLDRTSPGGAVFHETRTAGRIAEIKEALGGYHLYLWRNPWDQWWSYKVADYFDAASLVILNASYRPRVIDALREAIGFRECANPDPSEQLGFYQNHPIGPRDSYLVFYVLWALGLLEGLRHADRLINIDRLADSSCYREELGDWLASAGIGRLDFSDCRSTSSQYAEEDADFFSGVEEHSHALLLRNGWSSNDLEAIKHLRRHFSPLPLEPAGDPSGALALVEHLGRVRTLARRMQQRSADFSRMKDEPSSALAAAETQRNDALTPVGDMESTGGDNCQEGIPTPVATPEQEAEEANGRTSAQTFRMAEKSPTESLTRRNLQQIQDDLEEERFLTDHLRGQLAGLRMKMDKAQLDGDRERTEGGKARSRLARIEQMLENATAELSAKHHALSIAYRRNVELNLELAEARSALQAERQNHLLCRSRLVEAEAAKNVREAPCGGDESEADVLRERLRELQRALESSMMQVHLNSKHYCQVKEQLDTVYGSRSWRITAPVRVVSHNTRELRSWLDVRVLTAKKSLKPWLVRVGDSIRSRPRLVCFLRDVTSVVPSVRGRLSRATRRPVAPTSPPRFDAHVDQGLAHLTPTAQRIHRMILAANTQSSANEPDGPE